MDEEKQALLEGDNQHPTDHAGPWADKNSEDSTRFREGRSLITRAWYLTISCCLTLIALTLWRAPQIRHCQGSQVSRTIEERVNKILTETPLIGTCQFVALSRVDEEMLKWAVRSDGHNDLPTLIRYLYGNRIYGSNFTELFVHGNLSGHVDLPRLKAGKVGGTFWSVYVVCPKDGANYSDANYAESR